eukprot:TRINITY_DN16631_c0_g1_i2.p1 TRINITY_DN16631_c0_g1~~TRINITY_DN16631_c0_g1_i2.p1  ORF type:complete len:118 (+),score=4.12 TRINITY_DN16631_c0_g1_i2:182-535(+)
MIALPNTPSRSAVSGVRSSAGYAWNGAFGIRLLCSQQRANSCSKFASQQCHRCLFAVAAQFAGIKPACAVPAGRSRARVSGCYEITATHLRPCIAVPLFIVVVRYMLAQPDNSVSPS